MLFRNSDIQISNKMAALDVHLQITVTCLFLCSVREREKLAFLIHIFQYINLIKACYSFKASVFLIVLSFTLKQCCLLNFCIEGILIILKYVNQYHYLKKVMKMY